METSNISQKIEEAFEIVRQIISNPSLLDSKFMEDKGFVEVNPSSVVSGDLIAKSLDDITDNIVASQCSYNQNAFSLFPPYYVRKQSIQAFANNPAFVSHIQY